MASTRLRKTFKYPDSDGDDDTRPELDDQGSCHVVSYNLQPNYIASYLQMHRTRGFD